MVCRHVATVGCMVTMSISDNRDGSRLRQRLNPLLTSLGAFSQQNSNTPLSAVSYSSNSYNASTPASAIQPYNPQQWLPSPMAGPGPERGHQLSSPDSNGIRSSFLCQHMESRRVVADIFRRLASSSSPLLSSKRSETNQYVP